MRIRPATIATRGIAVTPTLRQVELFKDFAAQAGAKYPVYAATMQAMYDARHSHFEMSRRSRRPFSSWEPTRVDYQDHGHRLAGELDLVAPMGRAAEFTIDAATWVSQRYLGYPGLVEGGPADFVILDEDPRANPTILANPARVTVGGTPVWERPSA